MKNHTVKIVFIIFAFLCIISLFAAKIYENTVVASERERIIEKQRAHLEHTEFAPEKVKGKAKEFSLPDLQGEDVKLSDFKGRFVLLHFWATWCPGCVFEIASLLKFAASEKPKNLSVVAVSLDTEKKKISKFLDHIYNKKQLPVKALLDADGAVSHSYGTFKLPASFLIDPNGNLRAHFIGARDWTSTSAKKYFNDLK